MSYGATKWAKPATRARRATKRKRSRTKTAKKSRRASAPAAKKKRARSASGKKRTSRKSTSSRRSAPRRSAKAKPKKKAKPPCKYGPRGADGYCPKKPASARTVTRWNPETGRKVKVPADSPEAEAWLTRKPSSTFVGLVGQVAGLSGTAGVTYAGTRLAAKAEKKLATTVARALQKGTGAGLGVVAQAAGVSSATAAAGVIAAALVGWNLGKAINYAVGNQEAKLDAALRNYLAARREAAARLGRPLTAAELAVMYRAYQETVVRLKANDPTTYLRPGAE